MKQLKINYDYENNKIILNRNPVVNQMKELRSSGW